MSDMDVGDDPKPKASVSSPPPKTETPLKNGHSNGEEDKKPAKEKRRSDGKSEKRDRSVERSGKKKKSRRSSRSRSKSPSKRRRSRSREKKSTERKGSRERRSSRERKRRSSRSPDRRRRSSPARRSPPRRRSRSPARRPPSRSPPPRRRFSPAGPTSGGRRLPGPERRDVMPFTATKPAPKGCNTDLSQEERDQRTIFIMQLSHTTKPRDLEDFFSAVGTVRDVRIITDSKTRRTKGIAYIEFWEAESVPLAIGLNGQKLCGAPLRIQPTQAERSRAFDGTVGAPMGIGHGMQQASAARVSGPLKLYVGSLHTNIDEDMLRGIFEPFGRITEVEVQRERDGKSKAFAFLTFRSGEDGHRALEQLNGFDLAGRPMKVGLVNEDTMMQEGNLITSLEREEMERPGVDLGTAGRLALMAKLAAGTGLALPSQAQQVLTQQQHTTIQTTTPSIATQCFMLSNMFDVNNATGAHWAEDIRDDVVEECTRHGGVVHVFVDSTSKDGNVYVKCASINAAVNSVNSLHGRWFAGKVITANYVPVPNYHQLFPDALNKTELLAPIHTTAPMPSGAAESLY